MSNAQDKISGRKRKTVLLKREELSMLKARAKRSLTLEDLAEELQMNWGTLKRTMELGRCSPKTYEKLINSNVIPAA